MRKIIFHEQAFSEMLLLTTSDPKSILKILKLIAAIQNDSFGGIGKPELLKHDFAGLWSRRINDKDRLIYDVTKESIIILSVKGLYNEH